MHNKLLEISMSSCQVCNAVTMSKESQLCKHKTTAVLEFRYMKKVIICIGF